MTIGYVSHGCPPATSVEEYITHDDAMLLLGYAQAHDSGIALLQRWLSENYELAPYLRFQVNTSFNQLIKAHNQPYTLTIEALTPFLLPEDSPLTVSRPQFSAAASHVVTLAFDELPQDNIADISINQQPLDCSNSEISKVAHLAEPPHSWITDLNLIGDLCYVQYNTYRSTISFTLDLTLIRKMQTCS